MQHKMASSNHVLTAENVLGEVAFVPKRYVCILAEDDVV